MSIPQVGGSFAPPLTDELLTKYEALISGLDPKSPIREAMGKLLLCCKEWWGLPDSTGGGNLHPSGRGSIISLDESAKKALWEYIPWSRRSMPNGEEGELDLMHRLFDGINPVKQKELRDAAYHLLWHVVELDLDREPITLEKLG